MAAKQLLVSGGRGGAPRRVASDRCTRHAAEQAGGKHRASPRLDVHRLVEAGPGFRMCGWRRASASLHVRPAGVPAAASPRASCGSIIEPRRRGVRASGRDGRRRGRDSRRCGCCRPGCSASPTMPAAVGLDRSAAGRFGQGHRDIGSAADRPVQRSADQRPHDNSLSETVSPTCRRDRSSGGIAPQHGARCGQRSSGGLSFGIGSNEIVGAEPKGHRATLGPGRRMGVSGGRCPAELPSGPAPTNGARLPAPVGRNRCLGRPARLKRRSHRRRDSLKRGPASPRGCRGRGRCRRPPRGSG